MVGGHALFFVGHDQGFALSAHHHLVLGVLKVTMHDHAAVLARGQQGGLIDDIGKVSAGKAWRAPSNNLHVDIGSQRHVTHVHAQDLLTAVDVWVGHHHLAVEAARTQKGRVQHVWPVGGGDQDDAFVGLKAIHLDQQLVQRLLAFVVATAQAGTAMAADSVDLVNEDDAGGIFLGLFEHVAHAAGTDADKHLDEIGSRNGEEGHARFTSNGPGQQCLAGAWRADQQGTFGNLAA